MGRGQEGKGKGRKKGWRKDEREGREETVPFSLHADL